MTTLTRRQHYHGFLKGNGSVPCGMAPCSTVHARPARTRVVATAIQDMAQNGSSNAQLAPPASAYSGGQESDLDAALLAEAAAAITQWCGMQGADTADLALQVVSDVPWGGERGLSHTP